MTGKEQIITSAYHPQSNGLCERQSRIIKDFLIKVLKRERVDQWIHTIDGVLFAHKIVEIVQQIIIPISCYTIGTIFFQLTSGIILLNCKK